jgi:hypothetical protein
LPLSGAVSDESILALGRILEVQYIAVGSLEDANNAYRCRLYATNVESSSREAAAIDHPPKIPLAKTPLDKKIKPMRY